MNVTSRVKFVIPTIEFVVAVLLKLLISLVVIINVIDVDFDSVAETSDFDVINDETTDVFVIVDCVSSDNVFRAVVIETFDATAVVEPNIAVGNASNIFRNIFQTNQSKKKQQKFKFNSQNS